MRHSSRQTDKPTGRRTGSKNTPEAIERQKQARARNRETGKPTTANGWVRPGQRRGGRPRGS